MSMIWFHRTTRILIFVFSRDSSWFPYHGLYFCTIDHFQSSAHKSNITKLYKVCTLGVPCVHTVFISPVPSSLSSFLQLTWASFFGDTHVPPRGTQITSRKCRIKCCPAAGLLSWLAPLIKGQSKSHEFPSWNQETDWYHLSHKKNLITFHYTGWLIGILIMV